MPVSTNRSCRTSTGPSHSTVGAEHPGGAEKGMVGPRWPAEYARRRSQPRSGTAGMARPLSAESQQGTTQCHRSDRARPTRTRTPQVRKSIFSPVHAHTVNHRRESRPSMRMDRRASDRSGGGDPPTRPPRRATGPPAGACRMRDRAGADIFVADQNRSVNPRSNTASATPRGDSDDVDRHGQETDSRSASRLVNRRSADPPRTAGPVAQALADGGTRRSPDAVSAVRSPIAPPRPRRAPLPSSVEDRVRP